MVARIMFNARERPFLTKLAFHSYIFGLRFTLSAETENNWPLRGHRYGITPCQTSPILPLLINFLHEWPQPSMHIVQYPVHCTVSCTMYSILYNVQYPVQCAVSCTLEDLNIILRTPGLLHKIGTIKIT